MRKNNLLSFWSIIFLSLLFIGQSFAKDKPLLEKNIGKFITVTENGNVKSLQGASNALITSTNVGGTMGGFINPYTGASVNHWAGTFNGTVDGDPVNFYCIDIGHYLAWNEPYSDEGSTPIEMTYVLNNYYPFVSHPYAGSLPTAAAEASAIQAALWHFADGLDLSTIGNADIKARALQIVADVNANANYAVYPDFFTIAPSSRELINGTAAEFEITAFDTDGNPYSGLTISLVASSGILSANQVTTDANGVVTFTVDQSGGNHSEITATSTVNIPQGTQYFHVASPDGKQKLVLSTPTIAAGSASAEVNWYEATECDLHNYTTYTIGGWGGPANGGPGRVRDAGFNDVFPNGITFGGTYTLTFTSARAVQDFLPSGSTAGPLTQNYVNPTSPTSAGVLADQLLAATMNVYYHDGGFLGTNTAPLGGLAFVGGPFDGMTIYDFLDLAYEAVGGNTNTGFTYSQYNDAATKINENFDNGTVNKGNFTCATVVPDCKNKIGNFVWHDTNVNGIQDANEPGIAGVVIELMGTTSYPSVTSDVNGFYEFTELDNGTYTVKVANSNFEVGGALYGSASEKWYLTLSNVGNNDLLDSDASQNNKSTTVVLDCNDDLSVDFGFFRSNFTFEKSSSQTSVNAGDVITYNFKVVNTGDITLGGGVTVYDKMLNPVSPFKIGYKTVSPGETWEFSKTYTTTDLNCGSLVNNAWAIGSPVMPAGVSSKGNIRVDDSFTVEVICETKVSIGDKVWNDVNHNGIQDNGELGIPAVEVNLFDCNNNPKGSTTTDSNGNYLFNDLPAGDYYVQFVLPAGYSFSPMDQGTNNAVDSDANVTTGKTTCTTFNAGDVDLSWDAGMFVNSALGDKVWNDINHNGIQDNGELGVENVIVSLFDCNNVPKGTTTTDANGNYLFTNLVAGDYYVKFTLPAGYSFSPQDQGTNDALDSDADVTTGKTTCTTFENGENDLSWDAGIYVNSSLGDKVWNDVNHNGIQDSGELGVANVTVKLFDCSNNLLLTTTTDANGNYLFTNLVAGSYTIEFVLPSGYSFSPKNQGTDDAFDSDANVTTGKTTCITFATGDNDLTRDAGIYANSSLGDKVWNDANQNGIQDDGELGVGNVTVKLYDCDGNLKATTTTNASGIYLFNNLVAGSYTVEFVLPSGYAFSPKNQGSDSELDSDVDASGKTTCITFTTGENDLSWDAGVFVVTKIGDKVWKDLNTNGIQDANEPGIENVTVNLYDCDDNLKGTTTTDANGNYLFTNLLPGDYYVQFVLPTNYQFSPQNQGSSSALDSDADISGRTVCTSLVAGEIDLTWDAGMFINTKLGDRVWFDVDKNGIQDLGEEGIENVTVKLFDCGGVLKATTTTDVDGYYLFENLDAGSYYVKFVLPSGYLFTTQNATGDTEADSDADVSTGKTTCITLVDGQTDESWDAGLYTVPTNDFDLSIVKSANNTNPDDEAIVTYTITVTNNSSIDGTGIVVSDVLPAGLIYQSSAPAGYDAQTGVWNVGNLNAGSSTSLDITVKVDYLSLGTQPIFDLGVAAPYNLFVLKDVVQPSSDTEGRVAVGRNATFGNYSIGDKLPPSGGTDDVLVVGRKLTYTSGRVYSGNVVYGHSADIPQINLVSDGTIRKENPVPVDFAQATTELNSLSTQLAARVATGTTTFQWGGLFLTGTNPILNVFEVDGNDLSVANNMEIDVPNGSVVVVNVNRYDVSWTGGLVVKGTAIGNVLYNFHKAGKLRIQGIDIQGSILAPKARVNFVTGVINGQMICKFFEGQGQMNNSAFHGSIHGNPEITNCAEIQSVNEVDVNLSNNISCAPIVVNVEYNPNNGDDQSGESQWVETGSTGLSEMIWSMQQTSYGLLVGTVGGNIYSNNGNDFVLLNDGMNVTYVWSIYEYNNNLYAGTEQGLFRYDGSDWTKVNITGDVRSITSLNDVLYAAVWGLGMYSSSDNGATWTAMNNGLAMSGYAVQTLTVANGELFVGTFGLGVLRYDFTNSTWVEMPVGYSFIWSLATDSNNNIYAATFGGGVYASPDNGESWIRLNNGLQNMYVYSVSIFEDDIYVSTWAGGVYKFGATTLGKADNANPSVATATLSGTWSSIGMSGIEVSSIMVDATTNTLIAGTSSGTIYKKLDGVTDVNSDLEIPTKFELEQNYPNPFNPSTKIEFSIAKAGLYAVKVFNVLGQEVATIISQDFSAGKYSFNFDANNLTSGIYFYKLVGENVNLTKKMMLLK